MILHYSNTPLHTPPPHHHSNTHTPHTLLYQYILYLNTLTCTSTRHGGATQFTISMLQITDHPTTPACISPHASPCSNTTVGMAHTNWVQQFQTIHPRPSHPLIQILCLITVPQWNQTAVIGLMSRPSHPLIQILCFIAVSQWNQLG